MTLEQEHILLFRPRVVYCGHCKEETSQYVGNHGLCVCGDFECWSRDQDTIKAAHQVHIEHARQQRSKEEARFKVIRQGEHKIVWRDETFSPFTQKYQAWCSGPECSWSHAGSQVSVLSAFQKHQYEL